ncbi:MAG: lipoyl synthase [candidate division NC10 bacterium]|nr:lipoyl synthase [candidate division NC10 bacterium]
MAALLHRHGLNTVCEEARCPNQGECFAQRTATFMILGKVCTRSCRFCSVSKGLPSPLDPEEPWRVAAAAKQLELRHVVITSVTRDDLEDGGARHFAATAEAIRTELPGAIMEVLIPDLGGKEEALQILLAARPHILGHNLETVPRLYPSIRPEANYERSLRILKQAKERGDGIFTKSGLMLGLGESLEEVERVLQDLRRVGCDLLALGQYLQPTPRQVPVQAFLPPDLFSWLKEKAQEMGFAHVASAPLVRSSYHSEEAYLHIRESALTHSP